MIHLGMKSFYEQVSNDMSNLDLILVEGTGWRTRSKSRYDLFAHRIGLVTQREQLKYPASAEIENIDMSVKDFRRRFFRLPIGNVFSLLFARFTLWFATIKYDDVDFRELMLSSLIERHKRGAQGDVHDLVVTKRDAVIVGKLIARLGPLAQNTSEETRVGVVFGANHMNAIAKALRDNGFRRGSRKWYTAIAP